MRSKPQIIEVEGKPAFAVLPIAEWRRIEGRLEDLEDVHSVARYLANSGRETLPAEMVYAMVEGQSALRVWREHRGHTLSHLAKLARISAPYLSQLETGKRQASQAVLRRLAKALQVEVDDLL